MRNQKEDEGKEYKVIEEKAENEEKDDERR